VNKNKEIERETEAYKSRREGGRLDYASLMRPIDRSRNAVRELSRYAAARTFATAVTAASFADGVIVSPSFSAN